MRILSVLAIVGLFVAPVSAEILWNQGILDPTDGPPFGTPLQVDGEWVVLDEFMPPGSYYAPIFTYSTDLPEVRIDITDLFVISDRNAVYVDGIPIGSTPLVPDWPTYTSDPFDPVYYVTDPETAWGRPEFSKGTYLLPGEGTHVLTLRNLHIPPNSAQTGPLDDGTVAFRLVPEPGTLLSLLLGAAVPLLVRRRTVRKCTVFTTSCMALVVMLTVSAAAPAQIAFETRGRHVAAAEQAAEEAVEAEEVTGLLGSLTCGPSVAAAVSGQTLEITGTDGDDRIAVWYDSAADTVNIYSPIEATSPTFSFDGETFNSIHAVLCDGDDVMVFDDSGGIIASMWTLDVEGGEGDNKIFGGIDLSVLSLDDALDLLDTLNEARELVDTALELLASFDDGPNPCGSAQCVVDAAAHLALEAAEGPIWDMAHFMRDMEPDLVQPAAQAVRDSLDRLDVFVETFVATDALDVAADAWQFEDDVNVMVDDFDDLLPMAYALRDHAEILVDKAMGLGMETQGGSSEDVLFDTILNHTRTLEVLSELCAEDPEPTETEPIEDLQEPDGLPQWCAELERRAEALESLIGAVGDDEVPGSGASRLEADASAFEAEADALTAAQDALGDDENPTSHASQLVVGGDALVAQGDALMASADALNEDWTQWAADLQSSFETTGDDIDARAEAEVLASAEALRQLAYDDVLATAELLRADAEQLRADLEAAMAAAAPLLGDWSAATSGEGEAAGGADGPCLVVTQHKFTGGAGSDAIVGSSGKDRIDAGDGNDLVIGLADDDVLNGEDGRDLILGGSGGDVINGGLKTDILIGNTGDDCLFGGEGESITAGTLTVALGDLYFGGPGDDTLVSGDSESDVVSEVDFAWAGDDDDRVRLSHGGNLTIGTFTFQLGELVFGGEGVDDILTGNGVDIVFSGDGVDTIQTGKGASLDFTGGGGGSVFRLAMGDLIFGDGDGDIIDSDDPAAARTDDDVDVVFGLDGNDTIRGYGGGMISIGSVSSPVFELQLGNAIFGGTGTDDITTLDGVDVIFGEDDGDTITTGKGDVLEFGSNFRLGLGDLIVGGADGDTIHGDDPNAPRTDDDTDVIFGQGGPDNIFGYGGGTLSIGPASSPTFELCLGNFISGGAGGDTITTLDGIDVILAGTGNDTVSAGEGCLIDINSTFKIDLGDFVFGQPGDDTLHGDAASPPAGGADDGIDVIVGGLGEDKIYGGTGGHIELPQQDFCLIFGNFLFGGPHNDELRGDYLNWDPTNPRPGIDLIAGNDDDDKIEGAGGSLILIGDITTLQVVIIWFGNVLIGGPGDDDIFGANDTEICTGISSDLDDLLNQLGIGNLGGGADFILGGTGDDEVEAYNGIDFVHGADGDDTLRANHGGIIIVPITIAGVTVPTPFAMGNMIFGVDGNDIISSKGRLLQPTIPPIETDMLFGGECYDDISAGDGFNLAFGNNADDIITADDGVNILVGNSGKDIINAGSGLNVAIGNSDDDKITATHGINIVIGNTGADELHTGDGLNIVIANTGDDIIRTGNGLNLVFANGGDDDLRSGHGLCVATGNGGEDVMVAGSGLNVLIGSGSSDTITAGSGLNVIVGNGGHDILEGGSGVAVMVGGSEQDRLRSGVGLSLLLGNGDKDILDAGGGLLLALGSSDDDVIVGGTGLNFVLCGSGNDQYFGGAGRNIAFGGVGQDTIRGGNVGDLLVGNRGDDSIAAGGGGDFVLGNWDNDHLASGDGNDWLFGGRGNDGVFSADSTGCDRLFGNRGNDHLDRCQAFPCDRLFGGRGNDTKTNSCLNIALAAPARGEVRGRVWIDLDGDGTGDVGHAGVTVTAGSFTTVTDASGRYRIATLSASTTYTVAQVVPGGFAQSSVPTTYSAPIGGMGIDIYTGLDFVNVRRCYPAADGWSCEGVSCGADQDPPFEGECLPVAVRQILRCVDTGERCDECLCDACEPSWEVIECACEPTCYLELDPVSGPYCAGTCPSGEPCELTFDGEVYRCGGCEEPCPVETASFSFRGAVTDVLGCPPFPVAVGDLMEYTYWFERDASDLAPGPDTGTYNNIVCYELRVGGTMIESGTPGTPLGSNVIIVRDDSGGSTGQLDQYEVRLITSQPREIYFSLVDGTSAITSDALLLCGDLEFGAFAGPNNFLHGTPSPACPGFRVVAAPSDYECNNCAPCPGRAADKHRFAEDEHDSDLLDETELDDR